MTKAAALFACSVVVVACTHMQAAPESLSVNEVIDKQEELKGLRIKVRGVLPYRCQHLSCGLSQTVNGNENYISIGRSESFDNKVRRLKGRTIVIEARLNPDCLPPSSDSDVIVLCSDRPATLADPVFLQVIQ